MSASTTVTRRPPASGSLAELVDIILDKGLVIDAYVRVSLVGIELLTIDIRVVVASVDTYLHFAEATNRLDLRGQAEEHDADLQDLVGGMAGSKTSGALDAAGDKFHEVEEGAERRLSTGKEKIKSVFGAHDDEDDDEDDEDDSKSKGKGKS
jgi:gas vesicle structural protein